MGRPRRINIPGGICHVTQQCHSKSFGFSNDDIKKQYLSLAYEIANKDQVEIICFSLQDSHPHWIFKLPETGGYTISQFMHKLNTRFGKWVNKTFRRKGTFWAGRFSSTWVEAGCTEFFQLTRYVDRNPLQRKTHRIKPAAYRWGSFHYLFKPEAAYPVTFLKHLFQTHPAKTKPRAWKWYENLVDEEELDLKKKESFFKQIVSSSFLGSERFKERGQAIYKQSLEKLHVRGISWIKIVQDYSKLFLPMTQLTG